MVPDPGGSPAGGFDFVSCVQESSATPLLDVQSIKHHGKNSPATYFPGLQQVVIRDYMNADRLKPHFGAGTDHGAAVVAINCSLTGCEFDGLTISSAGYDTPVAVRVYSGTVSGTTILAASRGVYSGHGVLDVFGKPVGEWKQSDGAGWTMSGQASASALSFLVSGEDTPRKVVKADGSESYRRPGACDDEPPTIFEGHLANSSQFDPPLLESGGVATTLVELRGARLGDALTAGLTSLDPLVHTAQLTAIAGDGIAKVVLMNLDAEPTDLSAGTLSVIAHRLKTDDRESARARRLCAGTVSYNGICTPEQFPPRVNYTKVVQDPEYLRSPPELINITVGRQLFVDDFLIQSLSNAQRSFHSAQYLSAHNPIIKPDRPWEGSFALPFSGGVWWEDDKQRASLFYREALMLSRFVMLSVSLTRKASLLQGAEAMPGRSEMPFA
eukprot:COSAG04_NODE_161_length_22014_cov_18.687383_22_plen_442_part_00